MVWNDPAGVRRTASRAFVDALLSGDRAAVIDVDHRATLVQPLTEDLAAVKASNDGIDSSGGTNGKASPSPARPSWLGSTTSARERSRAVPGMSAQRSTSTNTRTRHRTHAVTVDADANADRQEVAQ